MVNDTLKGKTHTGRQKLLCVKEQCASTFLLVSFTFLYTNIVHHHHPPNGILCINSKLFFILCFSADISHRHLTGKRRDEGMRRSWEKNGEGGKQNKHCIGTGLSIALVTSAHLLVTSTSLLSPCTRELLPQALELLYRLCLQWSFSPQSQEESQAPNTRSRKKVTKPRRRLLQAALSELIWAEKEWRERTTVESDRKFENNMAIAETTFHVDVELFE